MQIGAKAQKAKNLRPLLVGGSAVTVFGVVCIAAFNDIVTVAIGSAVLGLGQLIFTVAAQSAIARLAPNVQLDTAFGWFTAGISGGQLVGPLLGGAIVQAPQTGGPGENLDSINSAVWVGTVLSLVGVAVLQFSRGAFREVGYQIQPLTDTDPQDTKEQDTQAEVQGATLRGLFAVPAMQSHLLASIALLSILDILSAFLPLLGEEAGLSPLMVGTLLSVRAAASIISRALLPILRRSWSREALLLAALWVSGLTLALLPLAVDWTWAVLLLLTLAGFFLGLGQPLTMSLVTQSVPVPWRSSALAARLMGNRLGQVLVPIGAGALAAPLGSAGAIWAGCLLLAASGMEKTLRNVR